MKKLRFFAVSVLCLLFAGCYEVNEEIVINNNGSGTFTAKMDMSQLMEMMRSFGDNQEMMNNLSRVIDTTLYLKDITDSAKDIRPDQKALFHNGTVKLNMNAGENIFKTDVYFPFQSYNDLQQLMSGNAMQGMRSVFKNEFQKNEQDVQDSPADEISDELTNMLDVSVSNGQISRKLNQAKFKKLSERQEFQQMKLMTSAGMQLLYTTVIRLPRPVKKFDSELITLSDDKKTATLKYDLLKMLETPEKLNYSIYY